MKARAPRRKLAEFLAQHGVRYKWVGTWPAIPRALRWNEPVPRRAAAESWIQSAKMQPDGSIKFVDVKFEVPPDAPPPWVENIYECLFEKILPLKRGMTIEFYDAAIFGYAYTAISRELAWRKEASKTLPPESKDRLLYEEYAKQYPLGLDVCRGRVAEVLAGWKLLEAADYLKGFAYGIECQHREEGWTPSATTETLQIYKALLQHQDHVELLIQQKATMRELGEYVATRAVMGNGVTLAQRFNKRTFAAEKAAEGLAEVRVRKLAKLGAKPGKTTSVQCCQGEQGGAWVAYFKLFEKICGSLNIPRPPRGRPRRNS